VRLDRYADAGALAAVGLVNALGCAPPLGGEAAVAALADVLAVDPPSVAQLAATDAPAFTALAHQLRVVFSALREADVDAAAAELNALLARYPAHPYLSKEEDGGWRLHHHPADAALLAMWTAICAEGLARLIGEGHADRLGTCGRPGCGRVFIDESKNASRRFCSTACQNRVKAAAFRRRSAAAVERQGHEGAVRAG
jgi:predicted RNA-binding Zn ribbon-like protein